MRRDEMHASNTADAAPRFFLATAPGSFDKSPAGADDTVEDEEERCLNRFLLPTGEMVSCVLWHNLYHITGTDIVRPRRCRPP